MPHEVEAGAVQLPFEQSDSDVCAQAPPVQLQEAARHSVVGYTQLPVPGPHWVAPQPPSAQGLEQQKPPMQ